MITGTTIGDFNVEYNATLQVPAADGFKIKHEDFNIVFKFLVSEPYDKTSSPKTKFEVPEADEATLIIKLYDYIGKTGQGVYTPWKIGESEDQNLFITFRAFPLGQAIKSAPDYYSITVTVLTQPKGAVDYEN